MDCEQALLLISAQLDREISAEQRAPIDEHLREWPSCRTTMEAFRLQDEELRRTFAERRQAVAEVAGRVHTQLPDTLPLAVQRAPAASPKQRRPVPRLVWALAAAASLAG